MTATYDFSGYVTKYNVKCTDGRTIKPNAFKHNDGARVPLVWQHQQNTPANILGYAILEHRNDGVYAYGYFNDTVNGENAKKQVRHGDIRAMSIYANQLIEKSSFVHEGQIREASLVISGANPGAYIDNLGLEHSDGTVDRLDEEAVIYSGEEFVLHSDTEEKETTIQHTEGEKEMAQSASDKTVGDVFNTLNEEQKTVVYAMIAQAMEDGGLQQSEEGDNSMKHNVFDGSDDGKTTGGTLSHSQIEAIFADAQKNGSLKESFLAHAVTYGIENIDYLFPDARSVTETPDFVRRDNAWVAQFMGAAKHTPFSRIKSLSADITLETARAKGYVKGAMKKEEFFALMKRITGPTTVYKKQKLDRDDIVDITDLDVVAWLKSEMRFMLDEEIARAGLVGDGRAVDSEDKINETMIRPIYKDADLYVHRVELENNVTVLDMIDEIVRARKEYKGTGSPVMFTTTDMLTDMLLVKDTLNRRIYNTVTELEAALRVSKIVEVPILDGVSRVVDAAVDYTLDLQAIIVNPVDYTYGADKGGNVSMFDDFDIDYNQYKYLIEARCSGALTHPKSAIVIEKKAAAG